MKKKKKITNSKKSAQDKKDKQPKKAEKVLTIKDPEKLKLYKYTETLEDEDKPTNTKPYLPTIFLHFIIGLLKNENFEYPVNIGTIDEMVNDRNYHQLLQPFYINGLAEHFVFQKTEYNTIPESRYRNRIVIYNDKRDDFYYNDSSFCKMSDMCDKYSLPDFKPKKNKTYLFCNSAKKGKCQNTGFVDYDKYVLSPFDNELDKITIPENIVKIAVDHLQKEDKQEQNKNISAAKKVEKEIDDIQNRIDRLIDCIADEKDDSLREDYKNRISRLKTQQQGLKTNLTEIKNVSTEESKLTLSKILTLLKHSKDIFNGSNLEEKSEFLKIISSNFSLKGKTVSFFYKNLIQFLSKSDPCLNILRQ